MRASFFALLCLGACAVTPSAKAERVAVYRAEEPAESRCASLGVQRGSGSSDDAARNALREAAADRGANKLRVTSRSEDSRAVTRNAVRGNGPTSANIGVETTVTLTGEAFHCP